MTDNAKAALKARRDALVAEAQAKINEAEALSDELGQGFSWDLAYGMGGYYEPAGEYEDSDYNDSDATTGRWVSSSEGC